MKIELTVKKEFDVKYLLAEVGARYWEDADVDGVEDTEGTLIPCRDGEYWKPLIDIETGQILNWEKGKTAEIHYKSCDDNIFKLLDADKNVIIERDGYVISMMCPIDEGYGDYVKMDINTDGFIKGFEADFSDFQTEED
jgi:hypothetical protein